MQCSMIAAPSVRTGMCHANFRHHASGASMTASTCCRRTDLQALQGSAFLRAAASMHAVFHDNLACPATKLPHILPKTTCSCCSQSRRRLARQTDPAARCHAPVSRSLWCCGIRPSTALPHGRRQRRPVVIAPPRHLRRLQVLQHNVHHRHVHLRNSWWALLMTKRKVVQRLLRCSCQALRTPRTDGAAADGLMAEQHAPRCSEEMPLVAGEPDAQQGIMCIHTD